MRDVLRIAQHIYEYNRDLQLQNLFECIAVGEVLQQNDPVLAIDQVRVRINLMNIG